MPAGRGRTYVDPALEAEKKRLGQEIEALQAEKEAIAAAGLGGRRAALGKAGAGGLGSANMSRASQASKIGLKSSEEQIDFRTKVGEVMARLEAGQKKASLGASRGTFGLITQGKQEVAAAEKELRKLRGGERPLLSGASLPR